MEKVKLTNMCMIENNDTQEVLVQERIKSWEGITFPGGKLEKGEALVPSTIREVKEETGLVVSDLKLCGIKDWYDFKTEERYIVFLLKTNKYSGNLLSETEEGKVFWIKKENLRKQNLSLDFEEMLDIYDGKNTEFFYKDLALEDEEKRWQKELY